jgi:hypothetical protein
LLIFSVVGLDIRSGSTTKLKSISGGGLDIIDTSISFYEAILIISSTISFQKLQNPQ